MINACRTVMVLLLSAAELQIVYTLLVAGFRRMSCTDWVDPSGCSRRHPTLGSRGRRLVAQPGSVGDLGAVGAVGAVQEG